MKIIDILNKKANGTLKDGFKFEYKGTIYYYDKGDDSIYSNNNGRDLGAIYITEYILNEEVEEVEEVEEIEKPKEIDTLPELENTKAYNWVDVKFNRRKINELVQAVNNLIKESEKQ